MTIPMPKKEYISIQMTPEHRNRYNILTDALLERQQSDRSYLAACYLLSADEDIFDISKPYVSFDGIDFFAAIYGEFSPKHGDFKFKNLSTCADYFGYDWGEETAHNSLADCRATAFCHKKTQEEMYQELYQENIHKRDCGFFDESYDACGDYNG